MAMQASSLVPTMYKFSAFFAILEGINHLVTRYDTLAKLNKYIITTN